MAFIIQFHMMLLLWFCRQGRMFFIVLGHSIESGMGPLPYLVSSIESNFSRSIVMSSSILAIYLAEPQNRFVQMKLDKVL